MPESGTDYRKRTGRLPSLNSGAYLEALTDDELREQMRGNFPLGAAFEGAAAELARRSGQRQERLIKVTLVLTVLSIVATVLASALL